jgi:hypothetical protein
MMMKLSVTILDLRQKADLVQQHNSEKNCAELMARTTAQLRRSLLDLSNQIDAMLMKQH